MVSGLIPSESTLGYVQIRFKKRCWYKKVLKTREKIILSVG
jgi:ribosome biogenesis protein BMS1